MSVNGIGANQVTYNPAYEAAAAAQNTAPAQQQNNTAVTSPQGDTVTVTSQNNVNTTNRPDWNQLQSILEEGNRLTQLFREMIERVFQQQAGASFGNSVTSILEANEGRLGEFFANLEVDDATRAWAAEQVADDGYWGVAQTSERILGFARAFAGNDLERLDLMEASFRQGFAAAERSWGGELPEISQRTFDAVMQGFNEWRASIAQGAVAN